MGVRSLDDMSVRRQPRRASLTPVAWATLLSLAMIVVALLGWWAYG